MGNVQAFPNAFLKLPLSSYLLTNFGRHLQGWREQRNGMQMHHWLTGGVPEQIAHRVSLNRGKISYHKQEDCLCMAGEGGAHSSATCFPIDWNQLSSFDSHLKQTNKQQTFSLSFLLMGTPHCPLLKSVNPSNSKGGTTVIKSICS